MLDYKYKVFFFILLILSLALLIAGKVYFERTTYKDYRASLFFPVYINRALGDIDIVDMNGREVKREELTSGKVLLHFWATWCKSCEEELYSISRFKREGLKVFCISIDESKEEAMEYLKRRGIEMPVYFDEGQKSARRLGSYKFPETYLVKDGRIILKFEGPRNWDNKSLIDFIMEL